jgi:hypothetical protein
VRALVASAGRASPGQRLLVLAGLTGFAIGQPLLSVLGDDPTTLAHHGVEGASLVLFAVGVALVPPLVLWAVVSLVTAVDQRVGGAVYLLVVAGLVACFMVQVAKSAGFERAGVLALVAAAAGIGFAVALARVGPVATWASYTAVLPVLAVGFFVMASPASALLRPPDPPDPAAAGGDHPSVVLLVLDELPTRSLLDEAGGIDAARFPNLAAFAGDATWYRHSSALSSFTGSAVPSLLTGRLPTTDPALYADHPDNLFTLLAPTHELEVLESVTTLCPYDDCLPTVTAADGSQQTVDAGAPGLRDLVDVSVDLWVDRISLGPEAPPALDDFAEDVAPVSAEAFGEYSDDMMRARSNRAQAMLDAFDADKGPALYYLHLMLPHQPWSRWPDGELYDMGDFVGITLAEEDRATPFSWSEWVAAVSEQRHLLQLQYTDRLVGELLDGLRAEGLYDDSLVIVAADHGVSFETRTDGRNVTEETIDSIAYAPLLIKPPGQTEGVVDDSNLMTHDLVPTIADLLGVPIDWEVDGAPAGSPAIAARSGEKVIYDFTGLAQLQLDGVLRWHDADRFPSAAERWVGPLVDPTDPIGGLHALLDLDGLLGARLDDVARVDGGEARVDSLDRLERPPADQPHLALVTGRVAGAPSDAEVAIAIDGVVVGGSKLSTDADGRDGRFTALLPQGVLDAENEVRAALVVDGQVRELDVVPS